LPSKGRSSNSEENPKVPRHFNQGIINQVTSDHMFDALQDTVSAIGEARLGFNKKSVGTHSIRSGAAMAFYLGECPVFMIMLIGCWSSDAFIHYI
jgi:hypothetical protein